MVVAIKQMIIAKQVKKEIIINEIMIMKQSNHHAIVNYVDSYIVNGVLWVSATVTPSPLHNTTLSLTLFG